MSNYTVDQLKAALVQADAAGDTQSAQILANELASRQADHYIKTEPESLWGDFKHGVGELVDNWTHEGLLASPATAELVARSDAVGIKPGGAAAESLHGGNGFASLNPEPKTITGTLVSMVPSMAAAIPGWEVGAEAFGSRLADAGAHKFLRWAGEGLGGTIGSDITSGEEITTENLSAGTGANILMNGVFHIPVGLRTIKKILAQNDEDILSAAEHIGMSPSVGMTTNRQWLRTLENAISKVPGGGYILNMNTAKNAATMDSFVQAIKSKLGYKGDSSELGRDIAAAINKAETEFKAESQEIYDNLANSLPRGQKTNTRRFTRLIEQMNGINPQEGVHEMTVSPIARKYFGYIEQAGKTPTESGYSNVVMRLDQAQAALKKLDDYIGTGGDATADTADAKRMAQALRADIAGAYNALGRGAEYRAAQDHYAAGQALIAQARSVLGRAETGDAIYTRLFGNSAGAFMPKGVDTLAPLKGIMTPDEWNHVAAEVVHRMGLEGAGQAGAAGRQFNPAVFLTNWNRLEPEVKELLFDPSHTFDLDMLAKASEGVKNLVRDANHSNTAHHMMVGGMLTHILAEPVSGLATAAGVAGGSSLLAKLLINPKAARALAEASSATTPQRAQRAVIRLVAIAEAHPELVEAIAELGGDKN